MSSLVLIWKEDDKSDIMIARDENGPLLFEEKSWVQEFAFRNFSFGSGKPTIDLYNYKVVEL